MVDISPTLVTARWEEGAEVKVLATRKPPPTPQEKYGDLQKCLTGGTLAGNRKEDGMFPGAGLRLTEWSPRMPIGIYAQSSGVRIRNLTVTPSPDPSP